MKQFLSAIKQIAEEKGIPEQNVLETVEAALAAAYKRDYGKKGQIIKVKLDSETGDMRITQTWYVVEGFDEEGYITGPLPKTVTEDKGDLDERGRRSMDTERPTVDTETGIVRVKFNPEKHLTMEQAKEKRASADIGDEIIEVLEPKTDFGRIAAQTAKQVVIQRLREAERLAVFSEFKDREGSLISGVVQRKEGQLVFVDLGKVNGILTGMEQMSGDHYRIGQRLRFLVLKVEETPKGPAIILSRANPRLVQELFRMEVPEIDSGSVEVMGIAREPGSRTKIAVRSLEDGVDPIGSLVGQRGVRVQTVINELSGEKIDIILWDTDTTRYIANALSPAKVLTVKLVDDTHTMALAEVADDQFSLAIGKHGQNVRLAARLTGWKIDVRSPKEKLSFTEAEEPQEEAKLTPVAETPKEKKPDEQAETAETPTT